MTRGRGPYLGRDFILPALNDKRYGDRLEWVIESKGLFRVKFKHKSASHWTKYDAEVFKDWDVMKNRRLEILTQQDYYTSARARMKSALIKGNGMNKISVVKLLQDYDLLANKNYLYYVYNRDFHKDKKMEKPYQILSYSLNELDKMTQKTPNSLESESVYGKPAFSIKSEKNVHQDDSSTRNEIREDSQVPNIKCKEDFELNSFLAPQMLEYIKREIESSTAKVLQMQNEGLK